MTILQDLCKKGWVAVNPPTDADEVSVICRYNGDPIKAGFESERIEDSSERLHTKYRTGMYDVELKIESTGGSALGQLHVERADGYQKS